jgi:hypothetical protein
VFAPPGSSSAVRSQADCTKTSCFLRPVCLKWLTFGFTRAQSDRDAARECLTCVVGIITQAKAALPRGTTDTRRFAGSILRIEASADTRAAVATHESLSRAGDKPYLLPDASAPPVLGDLIETLIEPYDEHWKRAWRSPSEAFDRPFP